jgi:hypothetical protein
MPVAGQQIPNTHEWTNWEAVFFTRSMRQLRDATIDEVLEAVFSMFSASLDPPSSVLLVSVVQCSAVEWSGVQLIVDSCGTVASR